MTTPTSLIQCSSDSTHRNGLPAGLQGGSYASLIDTHVKPMRDLGIDTFVLHNPHGTVPSPGGPLMRLTAYKSSATTRKLHDVFADEWGPVVESGVKLSVYLGMFWNDPCFDDELSAHLHNVGLAVKPYAGVCETVYHDAVPWGMSQDASGVIYASLIATRQLLWRRCTITGAEGPYPILMLGQLASWPMIAEENEWTNKYKQPPVYAEPSQYRGGITRWLRNVNPADPASIAKSALAVIADGHTPAIDFVGLGVETSAKVLKEMGVKA